MTTEALRIAGYDDVAVVGSGGLGDVYRARRISTGGHVAIKVLRGHDDPDVTDRRVRRELDVLLKLKGHPNVVQIEEVVSLPTGLALVMEFVTGGSLMDYLRSRGTMGPAEAVVATSDIARALVDAHARGIVHRDVKPHNVMLGEFGQCKVCDFGIAAVIKDSSYRDRTNALSYRYASPEELEDSPEIRPAADVYSLGVTLRHLLTGETNETHAARVIAADAQRRSMSPAAIDVQRQLLDLVVRMTARDAAARPSSSVVLAEVRGLERELGDERLDSLSVRDVSPSSGQSAPRQAVPERRESPLVTSTHDDDRTVVRPSHRTPTADESRHALPDPSDAPRRWWEG